MPRGRSSWVASRQKWGCAHAIGPPWATMVEAYEVAGRLIILLTVKMHGSSSNQSAEGEIDNVGQ